PPSGLLTSGDALNAGRVDTRRPPRRPPRAASHHDGLLTPPLAVAMAARERARLRASSRHGPSIPLPWLASGAASIWVSRCRWSVRVGATADVSWHEANRNYSTSDGHVSDLYFAYSEHEGASEVWMPCAMSRLSS